MARPETVEFRRCIEACRTEQQERMGQGKTYIEADSDATHGATAYAVGYCKAVDDILNRIKPASEPPGAVKL